MPVQDDTRARLLEMAGSVFAEKGYQTATVREICERAGANVAAVNYHFGDKERLYIEAVKQACHCRVTEVPLPVWAEGASAVLKLHEFIHALLTRMLGNGGPQWHTQLMLRELAQPTAACAELVRDVIRPTANVFGSILDELLPREVPQLKKYLIAFSIVGQCFFYRVNKPIVAILMGEAEYRRLDTKQLAEHIADFSLAALGYGPPLKEPRSAP